MTECPLCQSPNIHSGKPPEKGWLLICDGCELWVALKNGLKIFSFANPDSAYWSWPQPPRTEVYSEEEIVRVAKLRSFE